MVVSCPACAFIHASHRHAPCLPSFPVLLQETAASCSVMVDAGETASTSRLSLLSCPSQSCVLDASSPW